MRGPPRRWCSAAPPSSSLATVGGSIHREVEKRAAEATDAPTVSRATQDSYRPSASLRRGLPGSRVVAVAHLSYFLEKLIVLYV